MASRDIHAEIADRIASMLEQGVAPWRQPWTGGCGLPSNAKSGNRYSGINCLMLHLTQHARGFGSSRWLTFVQAKQLGGCVRKGERGTPILIVKDVTRKATTPGGEAERYRMATSATVFNLDQIEGLTLAAETSGSTDPIGAAEDLVAGYLSTGPALAHGDVGAFYSPSRDQITMPNRAAFHTAAGYYSTLFHEIGHSTGHTSRLDRDLSPLAIVHSYAREELVAEFTAAFLCGQAGLDDDREIENTAAYLANWAAKIRDDPKVLAWAASQASKAVALVLSHRVEVAVAA